MLIFRRGSVVIFMQNVLRKISLLCLFTFVGCKNQLLPKPDLGSTDVVSVETQWGSPQNLTATQGLKGKIDLNWSPVKNAVRYYIYRAETPFSAYKQIGETQDSVASYSVVVPAGTDAYFKIKAVDINDSESDFSVATRGTSLAKPLISDVVGDAQEGDTSVTVYWYMNNLESYKDSVRYEAVCLDLSKNEKFRLSVSSGETKAVISGLVPNTHYFYRIEAYNIADQTQTEVSDEMDAQTARRLRPNAPEELTFGQGAYSDKVEISFTLPETVDVAVEKKVYEQKPLYFKIYRKLTQEDDSKYIPVCSYFGAYEKETDTNLFGSECFASQYTPDSEDLPYKVGQKVKWEDKNVKRGQQYTYKVQSYADKVTNIITSEKSFETGTGWAVAPITYQMKDAVYEDGNDEKGEQIHKKAVLSGILTFDSKELDEDYSYDLSVMINKIAENGELEPEEVTSVKSGLTRSQLQEFVYPVNLPEQKGNYSFEITVTNKNSGWSEKIKSSNSRYIVPELNPLIVENALVKDGFTDRFKISFTKNPENTYKIEYKLSDENDYKIVKEIPPDAGNSESKEYVYEFIQTDDGNYTVKSGDVLKFKITPIDKNGKSGVPYEFDGKKFYTLGTPKVSFDPQTVSQNSLTVSWQKIEKATSYEVTYAYKNVDETKNIKRNNVDTSFKNAYNDDKKTVSIDEQLSDENITVTFEKPIGYDYTEYSGKEIEITVKAINKENETQPQTEGKVIAYTLGPAAAQVTASVAEKEKGINVNWKKVPGAAGYLIARTRYGALNADDSKSEDGEFVYFYDADSKKLSVYGYEINLEESGIKVDDNNENFILTDNYADSTTVSADDTARKFYIEQDKIGWGYPYRYQIFPVKSSSYNFERKDNKCTIDDVTFLDADKNYAVGSAIGYGLDVKASKAESTDTVTVTWTKPYFERKNLKPILLRVESESENKKWKNYAEFESDMCKAEVKITKEEKDFKNNPFDYVVKYIPDNSSYFEYSPVVGYLKAQKGDKKLLEPANKGYFFTLEGATVQTDKYTEVLNITPYNWEERKNGPEKYEIYIKNNNIDEKYHLVADVLVNQNNYGELNNVTNDIKVDANGSKLKFTPEFNENVHKGLLKVLRDYKHYYAIAAVRTVTDSEGVSKEIRTFFGGIDENETVLEQAAKELETGNKAFTGNNDSIYAYREITDEELVRAATLAMAYGVQQTGYNWYTTLTEAENKYEASNPGSGSAIIKSQHGTTIFKSLIHNFSFDKFCPVMPTKGNQNATFLKVQGTMTGWTGDGGSSGQHYAPRKYQNGTFTITSPNECGTLYNATMTISDLEVGSTSGIKITTENGTTPFGNITPFVFGKGDNKFSANPLNNRDEQWQ